MSPPSEGVADRPNKRSTTISTRRADTHSAVGGHRARERYGGAVSRLTTSAVTVAPGRATAIVGPQGVGLVDLPATDDRTRRLAAAFTDGGGLDEVLDVLADLGLRDLPSFGFVVAQERGIRAISRGDVRLRVTAKVDLDPGVLSGAGLVTWREVAVPAAQRVALVLADAGTDTDDAAPLPAGAEVVPASAVHGQVDDDLPAEDDLPVQDEPPTEDEPSTEVAGALVTSITCPAAHPNRVEAETCWVCGEAILDRTVVTIGRPDLGRLVFDGGRSVGLHRPVIIGRNPPDDAELDGEPATPFRVPDPEAILSRQHLEVRIDGWNVMLVDRKSRNFTTITRPGERTERLLPGIPAWCPPGSSVVLADLATFRYEPPS